MDDFAIMCGMRQRLSSMRDRMWHRVMTKLPVPVHTYGVLAQMAVPELVRTGLLDERGRRGFLGRLHQVYWWSVVVIVLLIPTKPDQLTFYFPAVLGLAAAWLFAMPAYAQGLVASSADFSALRPSPNFLRDFVARMRARPIQLPAVFDDEAQVADAGAMMASELPALVPSALLVIVARLSTSVVLTSIVAVVGLLVGPWLASLHVSWLHDWSPIAVLYALSAPVLPFLLGSLLLPILGYTYLASRQAERQMQHADEQRARTTGASSSDSHQPAGQHDAHDRPATADQ